VILIDVNLLVYAFRTDSPYHRQAKELIESARENGSSQLVSAIVAASFVRIVTNPRIFVTPSSIDEAWRFIEFLECTPAAHWAELDAHTYSLFKHLCLVTGATGNGVPDALLAAIALRHRATLVTADRGFSAYPGVALQVVDLSADAPR
jgi:hypothetical protein